MNKRFFFFLFFKGFSKKMENPSLFQILKSKRNPPIPKHIILIIVENYSYMCRLQLNWCFGYQYTIFRYYRTVLDCKQGYMVISRCKGVYYQKTIIQDEFGKVDIRHYSCVIPIESSITQQFY